MRLRSAVPQQRLVVSEFIDPAMNCRFRAAPFINVDAQARQHNPVHLHDGVTPDDKPVNANRPIDVEFAFYSGYGPSIFKGDNKGNNNKTNNNNNNNSDAGNGNGGAGSGNNNGPDNKGQQGGSGGEEKKNESMSIGANLRQSEFASQVADWMDIISAREAFARCSDIWKGKQKPDSAETLRAEFMKSCRAKPKKAGSQDIDPIKLAKFGETLYMNLRFSTEIRVNGEKMVDTDPVTHQPVKGADGKPLMRKALPSDIDGKGGDYRACIRYEGFKITGNNLKEITPKFHLVWIDHIDLPEEEDEPSRLESVTKTIPISTPPPCPPGSTGSGSSGSSGCGSATTGCLDGNHQNGEDEDGDEEDPAGMSPLSKERYYGKRKHKGGDADQPACKVPRT